jgi:lipopolysaccharide assembly LptE-like protein
MPNLLRYRRHAALALALAALAMPACMERGRPVLFGYTFGPLHDEKYRTIFVPVFENRAFQSGPLRELESDLTRALQQEIEQTTSYKVVHDRARADTELLVTIVQTPKNLLNRNQLNEVREAEMILQVEVVWRDVHTGEILSRPGPGQGAPPAADPSAEKPIPRVAIQARGRFVPELGESTTTALQRAGKNLAVQIVSLMESRW